VSCNNAGFGKKLKCNYVYQNEPLVGQKCERNANYGTNRCPRHGGGKPLKGKPSGHRNFKTGEHSNLLIFRFAGQIIAGKEPMPSRYKKIIPERLAEKYLESVNDPEIIAITDDIALVETRIKQLLDKIDKDEPPPVWEEAYDAFQEFMMHKRLGNVDAAKEKLDYLQWIFEKEKSERASWDEILFRLEQRVKFSVAEGKRRIDMKNLMNAEQAMDMVTRLLAAVNDGAEDVITDEQLRKQLYLAIGQRFARITGSGDPSVVESVRAGTVKLARPSGLD
jgi:hypothetical protein